ncbi:hypothetical protein K3495_g2009 [Podosphaera aphanis]|nr:hypothetical protein K3495_g2009 [Podosphaera aphanis]
MMSSPRTPKHSRQSSNIDPLTLSHSRTHSRTSGYSPITHLHSRPSLNCGDSIGNEVYGNSSFLSQSNAFGNLADELADAWEEDGEECDGLDECAEDHSNLVSKIDEAHQNSNSRDSGVDVSPLPNQLEDLNLSPQSGRGHRKKSSEPESAEQSDYYNCESDRLPHSLLTQIDAVECLAREGMANSETNRDEVVKRVIEELKDLGEQSRVESGTTRLITAHSALSTHLLHQARLLQSLSFSLFSPLTNFANEESIDEIMPLLVSLGESIPRPSTTVFSSMVQLHSLTSELIDSLEHLSDTLNVSRQATTSASRRLRSARELVSEMQKIDEARQEGESWLQRNNWPERLHNRECARVCHDVLGGFDEVCNGWRARLVAQAEIVGA